MLFLDDDIGSQFGKSPGLVHTAIEDIFNQSSKSSNFVVASSMLKVSGKQ